MRLTILCDNNVRTDTPYLGEAGFSVYIEDGDERILFDTGCSYVYRSNAEKMGIDLQKITAIVLSHGHYDHTGGLGYFPQSGRKVPLYAHPWAIFPKRFDSRNIGIPTDETMLRQLFDLRLSRGPVKLSPRLLFLGEIPRRSEEGRSPMGECCADGIWQPDHLIDDSAIVYCGREGLYIITGCSHAGIRNIVDYAKEVCGDHRILGILGGLHLVRASQRTDMAARWLGELGTQELRPCHCTCMAAKVAISAQSTIYETCVGDTIELL